MYRKKFFLDTELHNLSANERRNPIDQVYRKICTK
jgi:hypothetical protein